MIFKNLNLFDGLGGLHGDRDLAHAVNFNLSLKGSRNVDGSIDSSTDQLLGEWADDSNMGMDFGIDDRHQLSTDLGGDGNSTFGGLLALVRSLDGVNDGNDFFAVAQESSAGWVQSLNVNYLKLVNMGIS